MCQKKSQLKVGILYYCALKVIVLLNLIFTGLPLCIPGFTLGHFETCLKASFSNCLTLSLLMPRKLPISSRVCGPSAPTPNRSLSTVCCLSVKMPLVSAVSITSIDTKGKS